MVDGLVSVASTAARAIRMALASSGETFFACSGVKLANQPAGGGSFSGFGVCVVSSVVEITVVQPSMTDRINGSRSDFMEEQFTEYDRECDTRK